ncbi:MAG TPA: tripartite tricarboxylate transporter substrate binding protein [Burkholderiales bacterium]|nr:tripartite tricarboxylate transporter substrate binding protein [Burkholderiales bacterium]
MTRFAILLLAAAALAASLPASAQSFPAKPVRVIVVYPPGGISDGVARLLAEKMSPGLGQQVVVENRGGAGGAIGMDAMAKSAPDGHTIAFGAISPLTLLPHVGKVPYDALADIVPLASVMYSPVYLLATPAFAGKDFGDVVAQAKARPGALRAGTSGMATLGHLMVEQLRIAGVDLVHVPYRGGGQVVTDAAGGQFELFTANPSAGVNAMLQQGKFRILAVAAPKRLAARPDIPTLIELGYPDSSYTSHFGFFAPAKAPEAALKRLHAEVNAALALPDVADRLAKLDNVPAPASMAEFAQIVRREHAQNARVVAKAGIRSE